MAEPTMSFAMTEMASYYQQGREQNRLLSGGGQLEYARTQELLLRFLPIPPASVLDVGGGAGIYAFWLAEQGYNVHLVDATPLHIEQARHTETTGGGTILASMTFGDARRLDFAEASMDAVLLAGPLYHLTERADRILALQEAYRVLRPGGIVCAVAISRFASLMDGLLGGLLHDPDFVPIVTQDLHDGQHRNPNNHPGWFTTTFFHHPNELRDETRAAGFVVEQMLAIEGPGSLLSNLSEFWDDTAKHEMLLAMIRAVESESSLLGASSHFMAIGRKPA